MRYQGIITRWNEDRGFGFITPDGSRNLVFVHIRAFADTPQRPVLNEKVFYELSDEQIGRPKAENVTFVSDGLEGADSGKRVWPFVLAAFILFLVAASAVGFFFLEEWLPVIQRLWSTIRFDISF